MGRLVFIFALLVVTGTGLSAEPATSETVLRPPSLAQTGTVELSPQMSILSPALLVLRGAQFTVPYSDSFLSLPAFQLGIGFTFAAIGNVDLILLTKVGYATRAGVARLVDGAGNVSTGNLRLHWVPLTAALRAQYRIPGADFFKPSLAVGSGVQLFHQTGVGASETFAMPFLSITPALTFLEGGTNDWFGGFTFGTSYLVGFGPHSLRGWSFDLALNIRL